MGAVRNSAHLFVPMNAGATVTSTHSLDRAQSAQV